MSCQCPVQVPVSTGPVQRKGCVGRAWGGTWCPGGGGERWVGILIPLPTLGLA